MKFKAITLTVAMLTLASSLAFAAGGLNLYVGDCGAGSPTTTITNACTANTSNYQLYASVQLPTTLTQFVAAASIIDIKTADAGTISDWWNFGGCRSGAASLTGDATVGGSCATLWDAAPSGSTVSTFVNFELGGVAPQTMEKPANWIRIDGISFVPSDKAYDLTDVTDELGVVKLTITKAKSVGTGLCAGCATSVCIVLNEINFQPLVGDATTWLRVTDQLVNRTVMYNGGTSDCPAGVPVHNRTWGSVKAMYR